MMQTLEAVPAGLDAIAIEPQAFEAGVFGAPVWRLRAAGPARIDATAVSRVAGLARAQGVALMVIRLPVDAASVVLERGGFRMVERQLTFRRDIPASSNIQPEEMMLAAAADVEACAQIGQGSFSFDRFHADPKVPRAAADEIKARWARNGIAGRADAALVVRQDGVVAGFNLCMRKGADAVIDLIAVDPRWQGRGLGRRLVDGALAHYAGKAPAMWVSTQESNAVSVALYRAAGFALHGVAQTWHWTP
jgi:GNAT superfamily N-acetyltransferase